MMRFDCVLTCLVVSLLASGPSFAQNKASGASPQKTAPRPTANAEVDDSDLPKPFKAPDAVSKEGIPAFLGIFGPVELIAKSGFNSAPGKWIEYELLSLAATELAGSNTMRIQEVGPTPRGSRWLEMLVTTEEAGTAGVRMLVKGESDGNVERVIAKAPQMPPIEFPVSSADFSGLSLGASTSPDGSGEMTRGGVLRHVGQEKIKVPLGTFLCEHWVLDNGERQFDFWLATDQSIPFIRAVKFTTEEGTAVATKTGTDAKATILVPGPRRPNE